MADVIALVVVVCSVLCLIHSITNLPFLLNFSISFFFSALLTYCSIVNKTFLPLEGVIEYFKSSASNIDNIRKETVEVDEVDERNRYDDEITKKFRDINKNIIRDFIFDWYHEVSNDPEFIQEAFELFEYFFTQLRERVSKVDTDVVVRVLLQRLVRHHKCYKEANKIAATQQDDPAVGEDHRQEEKLLAAYETLNGHLAMSNLPDTETDHHRALVVVILKGLLPTSYRLVGTSLYLVRELIARNCVLNIVDMMAEPLWVNKMIYLLLSVDDNEEEDGDTTATDEDSAPNETTTEAQESAVDGEDDGESSTTTTTADVSSGNMYKAVTYSKSCHVIDEDDDMVVISQADTGVIISDDNHVELHVMGKSESESALSSHLVHEHQLRDLNSMLRFQQLRIPEAIEAYEVYDPSKKYTLYKIAYITTTTSTSPNHTNEYDDDDVTKDHQMEKYEKTYQVSRRYREFINLHERLSDKSPLIRKALKNVRAPSRGLPMGIGNMEKDYIEKRRFFLQAYLRHLCYIPVVASQPELAEFLAFESDPRIAFVGKPTEFIPRFDKMFKNAVSEFRGFFHTNNNQPPSSITGGGQHTAVATNEQPEVVQKLRQIVLGTRHSTRANHFSLGTRTFAPLDSNTPVSREKWLDCDTLLKRVVMKDDVTSQQQNDDVIMSEQQGYGGCSSEDNEIAAFLCQLLGDVWSMKLGQQTFTFLAFGRYMNQFVREKVKTLTQAKEWVIYLQKLQNVLWPGGKWCTKEGKDENKHDNDDTKTDRQVLEDARDVVREFLPDVIEQIVGKTRYNEGVDDLLESFQHPVINRHLIYHIFDSCLDLIFPDLHSIVKSRHNINL